MNHFFEPETVSLHNESEQLDRQLGISNFTVSKIDNNTLSAIVTAKENSQQTFHTSLFSCSCHDFQVRQKPCIHMYTLAANPFNINGKKVKFFSIKNERSENLIADFSPGYAKQWAFIVRPCNYESLDIKWQEKRKNKEKYSVLTQGNAYNFTDGTIFYDTLDAYTLPWQQALQSLHCALQINSAIATVTTPCVSVNESGYLERRAHIIYGTVTADILRPRPGSEELAKTASITCKQDEFLKLLKDGVCIDTDGLSHHFREG